MEDSSRRPWISLLRRQSCAPSDALIAGLLVKLSALSGLRLHGRGSRRKGLRGNRKAQTSPWHHPNAFGPLHRHLAIVFAEVFETGLSRPFEDAETPISWQGRHSVVSLTSKIVAPDSHQHFFETMNLKWFQIE